MQSSDNYGLPNGEAVVLDNVLAIQSFKKSMFDPAKAGMARSFFMTGKKAGFDMPDEKQANQFIGIYNAAQLARIEEEKKKQRKSEAKEKKLRKAAKAARKRNKKA